jgi:hypothetical protein
MLLSPETFQFLFLIFAAIIAISAVIAVIILAMMRRDFTRSLRPSLLDRIDRLHIQSIANQTLLETDSGRNTLLNFFISEANISGFLREAEELVIRAENDNDLKESLEEFVYSEKPWHNIDRIKKGADANRRLLSDRVNDLIKPYLGGRGSGDE